ncbi:hypothetical protein MCHLDSM_00587 [Mycolicibacterium chlorophenolicum]|uniref:Uncharacterized protein n=1 Tax=Mycolicibacterium chlorophenolicum TaxID=37916 RepID=A0A0J6WLV6_9MYCO|nr:hypothetical protein MCHLDSM_00587 [Mycolicibacterium chlorophenolicum]
MTRGGSSVQLDHYLEVLRIKPGGLPGSTALARAREAGVFTAAHEAFWAATRRVNGDVAGTRELVDVLLLRRTMTTAEVIAGITAALTVGAVSTDVAAVEGRRHAATGAESDRHLGAHGDVVEHRVVSLTQRRLTDPAAVIAGLPPRRSPCDCQPRAAVLSGIFGRTAAGRMRRPGPAIHHAPVPESLIRHWGWPLVMQSPVANWWMVAGLMFGLGIEVEIAQPLLARKARGLDSPGGVHCRLRRRRPGRARCRRRGRCRRERR